MITFTKTGNSVKMDLGTDIHYLRPDMSISAKASSGEIYLSESPSSTTIFIKFLPTQVNGRPSDVLSDVAEWLRDTYFSGIASSSVGSVSLDAASLNALESITVQNGTGASAVNIKDGGNSITIDGSIGITDGVGTVTTKTLGTAVTNADVGLVTNTVIHGQTTAGGGSFVDVKVNPSGALTVEATQSGTWNVNNVSGTVSLPTGAATESTLSTLNGKVPSNLTVTATRLLVDGSGVTQPVSGTVSANISGSISNTAFSINNASGASAVNIQDGGNSITVDAPVATPVFVRLSDGAAAISALPITDNNSSLTIDYATTGSGTSTGALRVELPTNGTGTLATVSTVTSLTQMNGQAIAMGTGTRSAGTQRVTIATDDIVPVSQSGTWTVQPGNTANTTPWLVRSTSSTPAQTSPSVTNVNTSILASNSNRRGATIYNEGSAICYMKLGATASTTSYSCQIASGGYYEVPFGYTGAIDGITSSGTAQLRVTELT